MATAGVIINVGVRLAWCYSCSGLHEDAYTVYRRTQQVYLFDVSAHTPDLSGTHGHRGEGRRLMRVRERNRERERERWGLRLRNDLACRTNWEQ